MMLNSSYIYVYDALRVVDLRSYRFLAQPVRYMFDNIVIVTMSKFEMGRYTKTIYLLDYI